MSSKGTPIVLVRLTAHEQAMIRDAIAHRNEWTRHPPWSMSDFIRVAVREKLQKMARSRGERVAAPSPLLTSTEYLQALTDEERKAVE